MANIGCFSAAQLDELQQQALIFKHLVTGVPVPPDLLFPRRFYHHPAVGYCSYYGKKVDPEPGRCRRTDGKKWRCAKDAHPDSKYCERHMHRSRSRSRKPVELSPPSSACSAAVGGGFKSVAGSSSAASCFAANRDMDVASYGAANKEYRFPYGVKAVADERCFVSESSGNVRDFGVEPSLDISWGLMPSHVSSPLAKVRNSTVLQSTFPQFHSMQDLEQSAISSLSKPQQQFSFFGRDFGSPEPVKLESQSLRPFFDEWPKAKDAWSDIEDERSNHSSFSNIQLAMSIPLASSDFSTTTSASPNDD